MRSLFLKPRFFLALLIIAFVMAMSYVWAPLFYFGGVLLLLFAGLLIFEYGYLRRILQEIIVTRTVADRLSLHHEHQVMYDVSNMSNRDVHIIIIDELPEQLQERSFQNEELLLAQGSFRYQYHFVPCTRGEYLFGKCNIFINHPHMGFLQLRKQEEIPFMAQVMPSVYLMKKYAMEVFAKTSHNLGIRRIRRLGESDEFEHLKQYQQGDNIKNINWKATSRTRELMVNTFQETRSQNVYCIIDKGRTMEMPSDGLTLLDHSINSALVVSNIVLRKYDKAGLITFSDKVDTFLKANDHKQQLDRIQTFLYNETTSFSEAGYEALYHTIRHQLTNRCVLILYTNFENFADFNRNEKYIELLSRRHLLVLVMFENEELLRYSDAAAEDIDGVYRNTIATSMIYEKRKIRRKIAAMGISTILTLPHQLNIKTINKYLEIKAKGMR